MKRSMIMAGILAWLTGGTSAQALQVGDMVPDVAVPSTSGEMVNLKEMTGSWKVLFFYPKAFTPGCTSQACGMRDANEDIMAMGVKVFGASVDSLKTQQEFKAKHNLPYDLLADENKELAKAFDALGMIGFASRKTYIIDPEGNITDIIGSVSVGSHDQDVIEMLKARIGEK
jgi:thioredoxin-dependent peroxiredoxin